LSKQTNTFCPTRKRTPVFCAAVLQEQNKKGRRGMGKNLPKQPEIHLAAKDLKK
jgi:hypothetical protein